MVYSRIRVERTPSTEKLIQPVSGNTHETAKFRKKIWWAGCVFNLFLFVCWTYSILTKIWWAINHHNQHQPCYLCTLEVWPSSNCLIPNFRDSLTAPEFLETKPITCVSKNGLYVTGKGASLWSTRRKNLPRELASLLIRSNSKLFPHSL